MVHWWNYADEVPREKSIPMPLCPPQIPDGLAWDWSWASVKWPVSNYLSHLMAHFEIHIRSLWLCDSIICNAACSLVWQDHTVGMLQAWGAEDPREEKLPLIKSNRIKENGTDDECSMRGRYTKCLKFVVSKPSWNGHFGKPSDQWDDGFEIYLRQTVRLCGPDSSSWGHRRQRAIVKR